MTDAKTPQTDDDLDLSAFDAPEDDFDSTVDAADAEIDDADFQDVEDDADVFGEVPVPEAAPKKGVNWFNIGVAVVAVVVAGGLIWSKLGPQLMQGAGLGGSASVSMSAPAQSADPVLSGGASAAAAQAALAAPASVPGQGGGLLDAPDQFSSVGQMPAPAPVDTADQAPVNDPFAALGEAPQSVAPAQTSAPVAVADVPMPSPISGGAPEPEVTPAPVSDAAPQPQDAAAPAAIEAAPLEAVSAVSQPVAAAVPADNADDLKARMAALEQKFEALDAKVSVIPTAPADDARLSAIQKTLDRLESRLDTMSSGAPARAEKSPDVVVTPKAASVSKPKARKTASSKTASTKWDEAYVPPVRAAVASTAAPWQLRGAKTGYAVIAKGDDLREVHMGDNVPGLGLITGIAQVGGRWVVQGTNGRVTQ